jgi:uroporphyrinogen III methyltransferase/synthase
MEKRKGRVYLVGAGPGDIGLLTVKGLKYLQSSDVIIYDFHLNAQILNYARKDAEFIYAGKRGGHHEMEQEEINSFLVRRAREGRTVCRLKGGDPFVFGRGGEEAEVLAEEGIDFEIVPGISSAYSVPAYAGVPLTHRGYASSFVVVSGNEASSKKESTINWSALAGHSGSIIFLMAISNIEAVSEKLIQNGKSPDTPVAVIRWGTRADQRTLVSTLRNISDVIKNGEIKPPAVVVVGDTVRLREKLNWFEKKPLFGQRILVTREHSEGFEMLEELGAEVIVFPTIRVVPPDSWNELDDALSRIDTYDWIVFTSSNAVKFFFERFLALDRDIRDLHGIKVCAIGVKTASEVRNLGLNVDLIPESSRAEGLINAFGGTENVGNLRILLPRAAVARELFPEKVRELGGTIDVPTAYRTVKPESHAKMLQRFLKEGRITIATFTSGSTFQNFREILGKESEDLLRDVIIAALGPVTARIIEKSGHSVHIMPEVATMEAMADEIINYVTQEARSGRNNIKD